LKSLTANVRTWPEGLAALAAAGPALGLSRHARHIVGMMRIDPKPPFGALHSIAASAKVGLRAAIPRKGLSHRLGHGVAAADIDAGGGEGAVRLLGGGGGDAVP